MKKAYIATVVFLLIGLAGCSSEGVTILTTETLAVTETIGTTETTEPTEQLDVPTYTPENPPKEMETTPHEIMVPQKETEPTSEPSQAPQKPPEETKPTTQVTMPQEQTGAPVATEQPVQTEPQVQTQPPEIINVQALIDYGREYAESTYGYEVYIGVRDGYYPPDTASIYTMEEGYKVVKASVDCTTRMLLARPGVEIVKEIDGVLCRARIDIAIEDLGNSIYRIWVYYG
jgi:hypothetical protein